MPDTIILPHMPTLFDQSWETYYFCIQAVYTLSVVFNIITIFPLLSRLMLLFNPADIPSRESYKNIYYYLFPQ